MRTDDLICMMAKQPPCSCTKRAVIIWGSVVALFAVLAAIVYFTLGFRPGLSGMLHNPGMLFKYAMLAALMVGSGIGWWRSGHPGRCCKLPYYGLIFLGAFLACYGLDTLITQGISAVIPQVFDYTAAFCAGFIALFAVIGSVVLVRVSKCMAPVNARLHAFMTALFAASLGALAYALHCPHDHPLYLALWYGGTGLLFAMLALPVLKKCQAW